MLSVCSPLTKKTPTKILVEQLSSFTLSKSVELHLFHPFLEMENKFCSISIPTVQFALLPVQHPDSGSR